MDLPKECAFVRAHLVVEGPGEFDWDGVKVEQYFGHHKEFAEFSVYTEGPQADGTPQSVRSRNLIANSDFDSGLLGWRVGWIETSAGPCSVTTPQEGVDGSSCLRLEGRGRVIYTSDPIPCRPNTLYTLSAWVRANVMGEAMLGIQAIEEGAVKTVSEPQWSSITSGLPSYQRVAKTMTVPGQARYVKVVFRIANGTGWLDRVQLEQGDRATDYVSGPPPADAPDGPECSQHRDLALKYSAALVREGRVRDLMHQSRRLLVYWPGQVEAQARFAAGERALAEVERRLQVPQLAPDFVSLDYNELNAELGRAEQAFSDVFASVGQPRPSLDPWQPPPLRRAERSQLAQQFFIIPHTHRFVFYTAAQTRPCSSPTGSGSGIIPSVLG